MLIQLRDGCGRRVAVRRLSTYDGHRYCLVEILDGEGWPLMDAVVPLWVWRRVKRLVAEGRLREAMDFAVYALAATRMSVR